MNDDHIISRLQALEAIVGSISSPAPTVGKADLARLTANCEAVELQLLALKAQLVNTATVEMVTEKARSITASAIDTNLRTVTLPAVAGIVSDERDRNANALASTLGAIQQDISATKAAALSAALVAADAIRSRAAFFARG